MKRSIAAVLQVTAAALSLSSYGAVHAAESAWAPERNVELVVPTSPGSAQDHVARLMQALWQSKNLYAGPSSVVNKPGVVAADYLVQRAGDPHLLYMGSAVVLSNHITGKSTINYTDMTPIAQLFGEYIVLAVNASSPIRTAREFLDAVKKDRNALSIALATSRGNTNHVAVSLAAKSAGIDPKGLKIVLFRSGGECVTALLGGHVDAVSLSAGTLVEHVASGKLRALAISAPQRMGGAYAAVPTWTEVGAPAIASNWRSVLGAKGLKPAEVRYWEGVLSRTVQTDEWQRDLDKRFAVDQYMNQKDSLAFLDEEYAKLKSILSDLALAK